MRVSSLFSAPLIVAALFAATPVASAQRDISQTKCTVNSGKCNIKFKNKTGNPNGSDGSSNIDQRSSAQTVVVTARKANKNKAANKLKIVAGASKSMNLDKKAKKEFQNIKIASQDLPVSPPQMSCEDVRAVLDGNGTCKILHAACTRNTNLVFVLGDQCDGGSVSGPVSMPWGGPNKLIRIPI